MLLIKSSQCLTNTACATVLGDSRRFCGLTFTPEAPPPLCHFLLYSPCLLYTQVDNSLPKCSEPRTPSCIICKIAGLVRFPLFFATLCRTSLPCMWTLGCSQGSLNTLQCDSMLIDLELEVHCISLLCFLAVLIIIHHNHQTILILTGKKGKLAAANTVTSSRHWFTCLHFSMTESRLFAVVL